MNAEKFDLTLAFFFFFFLLTVGIEKKDLIEIIFRHFLSEFLERQKKKSLYNEQII